MAKITAPKASEYIRNLNTLIDHTDDLCKMAVYSGAKVLADAISSSIDGITVHEAPSGSKYYYLSEEARAEGKMLTGVTAEQAKGLKEGLGIAPMSYSGKSWNTKVGFEGYNETRTKTYPKGQPNVLIARSVENGSSVREKSPFIAPAVESTRKDAEKAMEIRVDNEIAAIMKK